MTEMVEIDTPLDGMVAGGPEEIEYMHRQQTV